ncbi:MAG TPA: flagellar hook-length control protein FliK [Pirellulales bacterium]|jgi:flagellar hook-length control protein FliK|nr:flagellar hook-length control protein FliK [Pirellulales bacterium]
MPSVSPASFAPPPLAPNTGASASDALSNDRFDDHLQRAGQPASSAARDDQTRDDRRDEIQDNDARSNGLQAGGDQSDEDRAGSATDHSPPTVKSRPAPAANPHDRAADHHDHGARQPADSAGSDSSADSATGPSAQGTSDEDQHQPVDEVDVETAASVILASQTHAPIHPASQDLAHFGQQSGDQAEQAEGDAKDDAQGTSSNGAQTDRFSADAAAQAAALATGPSPANSSSLINEVTRQFLPPVAAKKSSTNEAQASGPNDEPAETAAGESAASASAAANNAATLLASAPSAIAGEEKGKRNQDHKDSEGENAALAASRLAAAQQILAAVPLGITLGAGANDAKSEPEQKGAARAEAIGASTSNSATANSANSQNTPTSTARMNTALGAKGADSSSAANAISDVDRVRFVQRVARAFQSLGEDEGQIKLRLSPPSLGSMKLEIQLKDGNLSAKMQTETESAKSLLLDNLSGLRDRLHEQNIRIAKFDVEVQDPAHSGLPDTLLGNPNANQQNRQPSNRRGRPASEAANGGAAVTTRRGGAADAGQLNVVI